MLDKLESIAERYRQLTDEMSDPAVAGDPTRYQQVARTRHAIEDIALSFEEYRRAEKELADAKELMEETSDAELHELAQAEADMLADRLTELEAKLKILLLPKDPRDEKNVIIEIRAGTGGEEAALFAGDLFRMYTRYAERQGWRVELLSENETELGGFKEVIFMVNGNGAFSRLKFESGVHRVQRVPDTEAGGRIHTSAATVAVLPEAEEVELTIDPNEIRVDVYRSSGHGGQSVNTTDSAVRITHLPTGLVVTCQDEKSQLKNREKALKILRARLLDQMQAAAHSEMAQARRSQVGTGDRSERIRTYNFPQSRCTDHRIGLTTRRLAEVLDGDLDEIIEALITADQAEKLKEADE
ncbi:MAG TPA: peptide chain release factor 1 [Firmicutes bacterium]|nr:peptide chain release factor 1 [Bacillota bacterium]